MAICFNCKKKISFFGTYNDEKYDYCKNCWVKKKEKSEIKELKKEEFKIKEVEKENNKIREYKRKCNQCGRVWHSLVKREKQLSTSSILSSLLGVGTALVGNIGASTQSQRNVDAQFESLDKIKKCPNCGSGDYKEEIIVYENS